MTAQSHVLIVGAHVGTLAIPLARYVDHVEAIEASPGTYELLRLNILLNNITNCTARHFAASDSRGTLDMLQGTVNSGGNKRVPLRMSHRYRFDRPRVVQVDAIPLDDLYATESFDVIVMDIEGSEYFALCGMSGLMSRARALIVEFVPHHLRDVAGISVNDFLAPILPHFRCMEVPSLGQAVVGKEIQTVLESMMRNEHSDDGLIFRP